MSLRSLKLFVAALFSAVLAVGCGGESAPAPGGVTATPAESSVTVSWVMDSGVEYWLFIAPTSVAPASTQAMQDWVGLIGGAVRVKATSPYVVSGLPNGVSYSFSINGRKDGGPGGPGTTPVTAVPRLAGAQWSAAGATGAATLRSVVYGATYVAAGDGGAMFSSTDGSAWTAINYATTAQLNGASYWGGYRVVGNGGVILSSADAVTWTAQTSGSTKDLNAIASNYSNLIAAVGQDGTILTSADGITWTTRTSGTTNHLYGVTFASGTWLVVGAAGTILKSTDGITWSVASVGAADLRSIAVGYSTATSALVYVAVGTGGTVLSSADATTWATQSLAAGNLNAVTYGTQFVTAGAGGLVFVSTDGVTWAPGSGTPAQDLYALARGPYVYSAVGVAGTNLMSK